VRGKRRIGNKKRYVQRVIMARTHKSILVGKRKSTHPPNVMVRLQTRMVERDRNHTLGDSSKLMGTTIRRDKPAAINIMPNTILFGERETVRIFTIHHALLVWAYSYQIGTYL
jgi:hypothetical protein